ncbi:MAG TPA: phosphatase PAP2 family protein [Rhizomicrobium sp.]
MILGRFLNGAAALTAAFLLAVPAQAGSKNDNIAKAGEAIAIALPIASGGISIYQNDWTGVAQMVVDTGSTVGTALVLKHFVHEERPDHSDDQSFPSDTAALAFAPAQFLWDRYGWEYGAPAYAAALFVGYSRVEAKQHHVWDVATSAALAFGYSKIFTTRFRRYNIYTSLNATPGGAFVSASYTW